MGYGGKFEDRQRARELRAESWTLPGQQPHPLHVKKLAEMERCKVEAEKCIGELSDRDFLMSGLGLHAGEGSKTDRTVSMANTNPVLVRIFVTWLRRQFMIDESRLRVKLYLHEGLDLAAATRFWSESTEISVSQFREPYRAVADPTRRHSKHVFGCATVLYSCSTTHRRVMAMIEAVSSPFAIRDSSVGRAGHC